MPRLTPEERTFASELARELMKREPIGLQAPHVLAQYIVELERAPCHRAWKWVKKTCGRIIDTLLITH